MSMLPWIAARRRAPAGLRLSDLDLGDNFTVPTNSFKLHPGRVYTLISRRCDYAMVKCSNVVSTIAIWIPVRISKNETV